MTHLPSHSWCRHWVMGRDEKRVADCRQASDGERQDLEIHLDYMFMGDDMEL